MAEYIERKAVMFHIAGVKVHLRGDSDWICGYRDALQAVGEVVQKFPAADVAPVVHAKWIDGADAFGAKRGQYRVCSRCNICIPCVSELAAPYWRGCPNCLARMDGEQDG